MQYNACEMLETAYFFNLFQLLVFLLGVLDAFCCHSNIILFHSIVSRFAETNYLNFIEIQLTGCRIMRDLSVGSLTIDY